MRTGGIILCGGKSSRMGAPKLALPFGNELMLQRVVRLLGEAARPIVVVAASSQELPSLPRDVIIARDEREGLGPLEGLRVGLAAIEGCADAAYVTGCDVPLLVPRFVRRMIELCEEDDWEIAVPTDGRNYHPLSAVYRVGVFARIEELLDADQRRTALLLQRCRTREVPLDELRNVDPTLATLENLNTPHDYQAALERAGLRVS
jgi:molybdopterin-guanine dinucleotide biosynthesis protein A